MIRQMPVVVSQAMRGSGTLPILRHADAECPQPGSADSRGAHDTKASTMIGGSGLTPALALDYVSELSADVRAALVLDAVGEPLAGPPALAAQARALLEAGGNAAELEAGDDDGVVCAVRTGAHAAIAVCGRFAIGAVVREDLRTALAALEGRIAPPATNATGAPRRAAPPAAGLGAQQEALDPTLHAAAKALISAVQRPSRA
jgi:hypothetical protein